MVWTRFFAWPAEWFLHAAIGCRCERAAWPWLHLLDSAFFLPQPALFSSGKLLVQTDCVAPMIKIFQITAVQRPCLYHLECLEQQSHRAVPADLLYAMFCKLHRHRVKRICQAEAYTREVFLLLLGFALFNFRPQKPSSIPSSPCCCRCWEKLVCTGCEETQEGDHHITRRQPVSQRLRAATGSISQNRPAHNPGQVTPCSLHLTCARVNLTTRASPIIVLLTFFHRVLWMTSACAISLTMTVRL